MPYPFRPAVNGQSAIPATATAPAKFNPRQVVQQKIQQLRSQRFKEGGAVEKIPRKGDKFKKPIKKKSFKKKRMAFKEGGAVERFLQKYPDYNPEA